MSSTTAIRRFTYGTLGFAALFFATVLGSMPSFVHSGRYIPKWVFIFASGTLTLVAVTGCVASIVGLATCVIFRALQARRRDPNPSPSARSEESGA